MTAKQLAVLRYICGYQEAHGIAPIYQEIANAVCSAKIGAANSHVLALIRLGYLKKTFPCTARAIEVLRPVPVPHAPDRAPLWVVPLAMELGMG